MSGTGLIARSLSFCGYLLATLLYALFGPKPDFVVTLTTPPLLSIVGVLAKTFRGCRHFIWEMDLYPEVAVDVNLLKRGAWTTRLLTRIATEVRRRADGVIVIGECMRDRLAAGGVPAEKLLLAENWADGKLLTSVPLTLGWPLTALYSGNLGRVHDTATIAAAMERMKQDVRVRFMFVGGGPQRPGLEAFCGDRRVVNAEFWDYRSSDALQSLISQAHVGLVTLRSECLGSSVPSKIYEYMAVGRPLLFVGPPESAVARVIDRHGCGWHVRPGDVDGLVSVIHRLLADRDAVWQAGSNARRAFLAHYDLPCGVSRIAEILGVRDKSLSEVSSYTQI
jgi:glycosyltransferase involved in cell wall biosynthesis